MKVEGLYLFHIAEAMDKIAAYTAGGEDVFLAQTMVQDAVIRNLEIIGEAAKRVGEQTRESFPEIPWKRLAGLRDVLIHQYEGVDLGQVWRISSKVLPEMRGKLQTIIDSASTAD